MLEGTFRGFEGEIGRSDEEVLLGSYATPSFPPSLTSPIHPPCQPPNPFPRRSGIGEAALVLPSRRRLACLGPRECRVC